MPVIENTTATTGDIQSGSIVLTWPQVTGSSPDQYPQHYGYQLTYTETNKRHQSTNTNKRYQSESNLINVTHVANNETNSHNVSGLDYNTLYMIEIYPYREMSGDREISDQGYQPLTVKTSCTGKKQSTISTHTVHQT